MVVSCWKWDTTTSTFNTEASLVTIYNMLPACHIIARNQKCSCKYGYSKSQPIPGKNFYSKNDSESCVQLLQ